MTVTDESTLNYLKKTAVEVNIEYKVSELPWIKKVNINLSKNGINFNGNPQNPPALLRHISVLTLPQRT